MEKEFYTVKEIAQKFSVTEKTIRRMMDRRELPYYQIGGRKRFGRRDIEIYLEQQRKSANENVYKIGQR
jgi:excisionase family DNA binding protein